MKSGKDESIAVICKYLPLKLADSVKRVSEELCEIRLRADLPVSFVLTSGKRFVTESGRLTSFDSDSLMKVSQQEIEEIFRRMCEYSVHSVMDSLVNGFITIEGGSRVGVYGTAVTKDGEITSIRNICGMNIRISGNFYGTAEPLWEKLYQNGIINTLICGPPSSGKTTLLRDIARLLSDKSRCKVAVVDERRELCGGYLGANTDVLASYPKAKGVEIAVRTLSPEVIICDEIGSVCEIESVAEGMNSGVRFVMSLHCSDASELFNKPQFSMLRQVGAVEACVFLGAGFKIKEILYENDIADGNRTELLYGGTVCGLQA